MRSNTSIGCILSFMVLFWLSAPSGDALARNVIAQKCKTNCRTMCQRKKVWLCPAEHPRMASCRSIEQAYQRCKMLGIGLCELISAKAAICRSLPKTPSESWCRFRWKRTCRKVCKQHCWQWVYHCHKKRVNIRRCVRKVVRWKKKCRRVRNKKSIFYIRKASCIRVGQTSRRCVAYGKNQLTLQTTFTAKKVCKKQRDLVQKCTTTFRKKKYCVRFGTGVQRCSFIKKPIKDCQLVSMKRKVCTVRKRAKKRWLPKKNTRLARCVARLSGSVRCHVNVLKRIKRGRWRRICRRSSPVFKRHCVHIPTTQKVCRISKRKVRVAPKT